LEDSIVSKPQSCSITIGGYDGELIDSQDCSFTATRALGGMVFADLSDSSVLFQTGVDEVRINISATVPVYFLSDSWSYQIQNPE
jgi:hypothetical protein